MSEPLNRKEVLQELCSRYWKPLYHYLRCKGYSSELAQDMVQDFFSEKILAEEIFRRADRSRGRLRNFLLTALRNHAVNFCQREIARKQSCRRLETSPQRANPEDCFNRIWAENIMTEVLQELKNECYRRDKEIYWQVFQEWFIASHVNTNRPSMIDICKKYHLADVNQGYNMIAFLKRTFRRLLRNHIRLQVQTEDAVDDEICDLMKIFSHSAAE